MKKISQYFKWKYQNYNLKKKIYVVFMTGIFFYLLIFLCYIEVLYNFSLKPNYIQDKSRILSEFTDNLASEMNIVNNMSISMMKDRQIRDYLQISSPTRTDASNAKTELYQFINTDNYIESVYLIHLSGEMISINYVGMDTKRTIDFSKEWKELLEEKNGKPIVAMNGNKAFLNNSYPVLSHMRAVYDLDSQKLAGYLVVNLSMNLFEEKIEQLWDNGDTYIGIIDEKNQPVVYMGDMKIASSCNDDLQLTEKNETIEQAMRGYAVLKEPLEDWGVQVLYIGRMNLLKILSTNFMVFLSAIFVLTIIFLFVLSRVMTVAITKPIAVLAEYMGRVKEGYLYRVAMQTNNDEIGMLKDTYNQMLVQINDLITKLVEEEREKNKLELDVLQEQINPHFLYNTLSSIEYLVLSKDHMGAYHALQTLGNFYKNFLSGGSQVISLKQELEITRDYIFLQKLRFHDIVDLKIHTEQIFDLVKVPRLILQPLVENSLVHGIYPKGEKGIITISVSSENNRLKIEINDDGIGMEQKMVEGFLQDNVQKEEKHFGLRGTLLRIYYFYNIKDFYKIDSELGMFTKITLYLPLNY